MAGPVEVEALAVEQPALPDATTLYERFAIIRQDVELDINFHEKSYSGVSTLSIFLIDKELEELSIDSRQCEIDLANITVDGYKTKATHEDPYDLMCAPRQWQLGATQHHILRNRMAPLSTATMVGLGLSVTNKELKASGCVPIDKSLKVSLRPEGMPGKDEPRRVVKIKTVRADRDAQPEPSDPGQEQKLVKISIPFRSKTIRDGLHFVGIDRGDRRYPHAYTRHSSQPGTACCLFPCVDDPRSRHAWGISIKCPRTLGDVLDRSSPTRPPVDAVTDGSRKRQADGHGSHFETVLTEADKLMEMTVVCSGNLSGTRADPEDERKKIMTFECKFAAAHHIGFAVGPFESIDLWSEYRTEESDERLGANAAKIHAYCLPGRAGEVRDTCAPIVMAADHFALEYAKYPFESFKICFLDDMIPDTVEVNSLSMCSSRLLYPGDILDLEIDVTRKLVHSLACQSLGVHIIPDDQTDAWLIIGGAWFMTDQFMKTLCGLNWYKFHIKTMSDKLVEVDQNRPSLHELGKYLHIGEFEQDFMDLKAPLVLFILDQRMNKTLPGTGMGRVISQFVSNANILDSDPGATSIKAENFMRTCEKRSHYRLDKFWQQWVEGAGCPKLQIKQRFNKKNLNVDISIQQTQAPTRALVTTESFWREFQEELHEVWAGDLTRVFTGPFTVRIHEADGTPYEHYLDIREHDREGMSWSIPYNTKYKRLKKSKKKEGAGAGAAAHYARQGDGDDDVVYFNMLGDVLQSDQDSQEWGLADWEKAVQDALDQESYEWIRYDCNFEWICQVTTDMPGYMYLAQLQQDRDVVAHQDAMLYFSRSERHIMSSTIEVRTLMDKRYYHGIRTMAASDLPKQSTADLNYWGLAHLILTYRQFFCYSVVGRNGVETWPPVPNDFSDKAQYAVQCAIISAIARTRQNGRCSAGARNFLLDLIRFNDNSTNDYSDYHFIARLLQALTTSLIPEVPVGDGGTLLDKLNDYDEDDVELKGFIEKTLETIERFRRMDEWTWTYHNLWTTTALDCKMKLMKAKVIPTSPLDFLQYCQDENLDLVRIKAFECLVELGMLSRSPILRFLLNTLSTDRSPYVRDKLFKAFCRGIAAIGLGEHRAAEAHSPVNGTANQPDDMEVDDEDDGALVVEAGDVTIQQRKIDAKRKEDIKETLAALKEELKGNIDLQMTVWKATESSIISLKEKQNLLDLCAAMFEKEDCLQLTVDYPKFWKCHRAVTDKGPNGKKRCIVTFTQHIRTEPRVERLTVPPLPQVEEKPAESVKIVLNGSRPSVSASSVGGSSVVRLTATPTHGRHSATSTSLPRVAVTPAPAVVPPPAVVPVPAPTQPIITALDSIAVQSARQPTPLVASPAGSALSGHEPNGKKAKVSKKRHSEDHICQQPAAKKAKTAGIHGKHARQSKVITLRFTKWRELPERTMREMTAQIQATAAAASTIVASAAPPLRGSLSVHHPTPTPSSSAMDSSKSITSTPGSSFQSNGGVGASPAAGVKVRKPLPSAPKPVLHGTAPPVRGTSTAAPTNGAAAPGKKKLIKLKIRATSVASESQGRSA